MINKYRGIPKGLTDDIIQSFQILRNRDLHPIENKDIVDKEIKRHALEHEIPSTHQC